jgi:hypothetical protein
MPQGEAAGAAVDSRAGAARAVDVAAAAAVYVAVVVDGAAAEAGAEVLLAAAGTRLSRSSGITAIKTLTMDMQLRAS